MGEEYVHEEAGAVPAPSPVSPGTGELAAGSRADRERLPAAESSVV